MDSTIDGLGPDRTDPTRARGTAGNVTRRRLLGATCGLVGVSLAGCESGEDDATGPEAVTLAADSDCDVCGMVIGQRPGPNAQIFYADNDPGGHGNPARFETTWEAFQFDFDRADRGWNRQAFYVTDYSTVDYELRGSNPTVISSHRQASAFTDATDVTFVVDSAIEGSMGPDLIGFSSEADANGFQDEHDGVLATFDEVTPSLIEQLRA